MYRFSMIFLWILIFCSTQQLKNNVQSNDFLQEFNGTWVIDYENTTKALLIKNKLDPEIDVDIYENFLSQIKKDIPQAKITFDVKQNENSHQWQFQYTKKENNKTISKKHQGTFQILDIKNHSIILELIEAKEKETVQIELLEKNRLKISLHNIQKKEIFNEIYFIKNEVN